MSKKEYFLKTYDSIGNFKHAFYDFTFSNFSSSLNGGLGDLTITLPEKFDDFNEGSYVDFGYEAKIYVSDKENPNGLIIYDGVIDSINAQVSDNESVTLKASGYVSQLALDILEQTTGSSVLFSFSNTDPSNMLKTIIDTYATNATNSKITYSSSSIETTGKTESLKLYFESPLSAINAVTQLGDSDWNWYIDVDNILYFRPIPTTAIHKFIFGKDVKSISFDKNIRDTRNAVFFYNALTEEDPELIFDLTTDATSISNYGRRFEIVRDNRYKKSTGTYVERANRIIDTLKNPVNVVTIEIVDSNQAGGYDIESIKVGDTFKVLNIATTNALSDNMLITTIDYNADFVRITAEDTIAYTDRVLLNNRNALFLNQYEDNMPENYT